MGLKIMSLRTHLNVLTKKALVGESEEAPLFSKVKIVANVLGALSALDAIPVSTKTRVDRCG